MIKFDFAPINTGFAKHGIYDERIIDFYKLRSGKDIDTSYVGNVAVDYDRVTNNSTAIFIEHNRDIFKKLAEIISSRGSTPGIQIASRFSEVPANKNWKANISTHVIYARDEILSLSDDDFDKEIQLIQKAIHYAVETGFYTIQLHAAHGYLLSRLLNRQINQRNGKYAFGCFNWLEDIANFTKSLSSSIILDIRFNILDGIEKDTIEMDYKQFLLGKLIENGCQKISLTNGFYDVDKTLIYPIDKESVYNNLLRAVALSDKYPDTSFSIAGNMLSIISAQSKLPKNLNIALGRSLIADPNAILNFKNCKDQICTFCGKCHYFSLGKESLICPISNIGT
jgi:NADPH2 dehydrogenase